MLGSRPRPSGMAQHGTHSMCRARPGGGGGGGGATAVEEEEMFEAEEEELAATTGHSSGGGGGQGGGGQARRRWRVGEEGAAVAFVHTRPVRLIVPSAARHGPFS